MKALITRDSCCAGDDLDAPHERRLPLPPNWSWDAVVDLARRRAGLPTNIQGGHATWALFSSIPLAVAAQQWERPRMLALRNSDRAALDLHGDQLRLHWRYFAQEDPLAVLGRLQSELKRRRQR